MCARGLDLFRVFFIEVAHILNVLVTKERIVVEGDLSIERLKVPFGGDDQRVDLDERAILFPKQLVEPLEYLSALLDVDALQPQAPSDVTCLVRAQA